MSGHSRWSQIRHKKGATDQKRGQLFSKLSRLITLAAKTGSDPKTNSRLAGAIDKARSFNMPSENIERAIKKVSDKNQAQLEEILVEAIGPGSVALRIKAVTDNHNRTLSEIRKILSDHEAKMVQPGSLSWMFGQSINIDGSHQEQLTKLLEALDNQDEVEEVESNLN